MGVILACSQFTKDISQNVINSIHLTLLTVGFREKKMTLLKGFIDLEVKT